MSSVRGTAWGLAAVACLGVWLVEGGLHPVLPPAPAAARAPEEARTPHAGPVRHPADPRAAVVPLAPSVPLRIRVPRIAVDAPLTGLGLTADGHLAAPPQGRSDVAGWYRGGASPGARGTAIVAGHVDTAQGPAVFYELGTLHRGDRVEVARADGRTALFTVDTVAVYQDDAFPDRKVYGAADDAALRLITCGGGYSRAGGYRGNTVVFAHLTGVR